VVATLIVPSDKTPGLYQSFINFKDKSHTVNVPVSYAVLKKLQAKDLPTVLEGQNGDALYGNGFIGGGFDMANRYNAGDWRQYYFDVTDKTINSVAMHLSWKDPDTNLSVFLIDPQGRIIQTNTPPGVLGQFQGWPTGDWLGPSPSFSEGGGFYPVKNTDTTSTVLFSALNQTGVYSILIHAPLFSGRSIAEPVTITSKFSTILPIESSPQMILDIPLFINSNYTINPKIIGESIADKKYYLDNNLPQIIDQDKLRKDMKNLSDGEHVLNFEITDTVGHSMSKEFKFVIDNTLPEIIVKSPKNYSKVSGVVNVDLDVNELNPAQKDWLVVKTPNQTYHDVRNIQFNTTTLSNGDYTIETVAKDRAGNIKMTNIVLTVDNSNFGVSSGQHKGDQNFTTLFAILVGIVLASTITIFTLKKLRISKRS
jgi:hypothetical protein